MERHLGIYVATTTATASCAVAGSLASDPDGPWYRSLRKPVWNPPKAAFPIVWTSLYATIALAAGRGLDALRRRSAPREASRYRLAFLANLALNAGWSAMFFRAHRPWLSAAWAAALAASSIDLARRSGSADRSAGRLLIPYALWSSFATALSTRFAQLNPRR